MSFQNPLEMFFSLPHSDESFWSEYIDFDENLKEIDDLIANISYLADIPQSKIQILKVFFLKQGPTYWNIFATQIWPYLIKESKQITTYFPTPSIPPLSSTHPNIDLPACAVNCLLIHMFLGTIGRVVQLKGHGATFWSNFLSGWIKSSIMIEFDDTDPTTYQNLIPSTIEVYLQVLIEHFQQRMKLEQMIHTTIDDVLKTKLLQERNRIISYSFRNGTKYQVPTQLKQIINNEPELIQTFPSNVVLESKPTPLPLSMNIQPASIANHHTPTPFNQLTNNEPEFITNHQSLPSNILLSQLSPIFIAQSPSKIGTYNCIDIDFANKDISFGQTGTQEEILFGMSPEMSICVLFTTTMTDKQSICFTNCQIVGHYSGYGSSLRYLGPDIVTIGNFKGTNDKDDENDGGNGLIHHMVNYLHNNWRIVLAIDAIPIYKYISKNEHIIQTEITNASTTLNAPKYDFTTFDSKEKTYFTQFTTSCFVRDLNKCIYGFDHAKEMIQQRIISNYDNNIITRDPTIPTNITTMLNDNKDLFPLLINTGAWGCGAFGGDKQLKFIQQWLAISIMNQHKDDELKSKSILSILKYNVFDDQTFQLDAENIIRHCSNWTIIQIFDILVQYQHELFSGSISSQITLFQFILQSK